MTMEAIAAATGWRLQIGPSGEQILRKPCGRVASPIEIDAVLRTMAETA